MRSVYLIRHAESHYNVGEANIAKELGDKYLETQKYANFKFTPELMDSSITQNGVQQCVEAKNIMADKKIDIVFVSPLRRALETCWEIFKDHPSKPQIIVDPLFKEILESSCDVGNRLQESMKDYPTFDFSKIDKPHTWYVDTIHNPQTKQSALSQIQKLPEPDRACSQKVAAAILQLLKQCHSNKIVADTEQDMHARHLQQVQFLKNNHKDKLICIVSHSQNLKHFIGWKIKNCEVKQYTISQ